MAYQYFLGDDIETDAAHAGGRPGEIVVDHVLSQAKRLEHLRAAIALDRGDAHLGGDLDDALGRGLDEVLAGGLVLDVHEQALADHVVDRLEGQVRVDRAAAITDQEREVMHFPRLAGLQDDARPGAQALAEEVVVQAGDRQERGHGRVVAVHAAVAQDDDVDLALLDHAAGHHRRFPPATWPAPVSAADPEEDRQDADPQARPVHPADLRQVLVGEDRPLELEAPAGRRPGVQEIALGTEAGLRRGDQFLPDAVDRGIGDLREEPLEIIVEEPRLVGQDGERRVVAHRAHGLHAVAGHRSQRDALVLARVAEGDLPLEERLVVRQGRSRTIRQILEMHQMLVEPLAVGALADDLLLDLLVLDDAALLGVDEEHAPRLEAALGQDVFRRDLEHARLRSHDHQAVRGHVITRGAQTVAIEDRTDLLAIGEGDGGRAVPGLHQAGMKLIERLPIVVHALMVGPRLGDHHHDRVGQRAAGQDQEFEGVVEHRGVAALRVDHRQDLLHVLAEQLGVEERLARMHPVDVAAQGVDLAVVSDVAIGMCPRPGGESVGAESRVNQGESRLHRRIRADP